MIEFNRQWVEQTFICILARIVALALATLDLRNMLSLYLMRDPIVAINDDSKSMRSTISSTHSEEFD